MLRAVLIFVLPLAVMAGGFAFMGSRPEYKDVQARLGNDGGPSFGFYGAESMGKRWAKLRGGDKDLLPSERYMLLIDLPFPCLYGGALMIGMLVAWSLLGRPVGVVWLLAPVLVLMAADWIENLVQLNQLDVFMRSSDKPPPLSPGLISIGGVATFVKLVAGFGSFAWLGCLAWRCRAIA